MKGPFALYASQLEAAGYDCVPILPGDKRPVVEPGSDWTDPRPVATRLRRFGRCGVGLLTRRCPACDIDVRVIELADAIAERVLEITGWAPVRYGAAPKRAFLCRAEAPFTKVSTRGYRLPGDRPGDKAHKVEVLADGQQLVSFGIHPGTGREYAWIDGSPLDLERDDLPELSVAKAGLIIAEADAILRRAGGDVVSTSKAAATGRGAWKPGPPPRPVQNLAEAREVIRILRSIDPSGLDRDTWIATGYAVKAALGDRGRDFWLEWSRASDKYNASRRRLDGSIRPLRPGEDDTPAVMWDRIEPERCGWRFLERLAGEIARG